MHDLEQLCLTLGVPYSEQTTKKVLAAYSTSFQRGAVQWRFTDRPGDPINYRFYERETLDTIQPAITARLLDAENPMIRIFQSWARLWDGAPIQLCDFDAQQGLSKSWLYLRGLRKLDEILDAPDVPKTILQHCETFHNLNLTRVRYVAVDFKAHTVNFYFRAPGPLTYEQATKYVALAGSPPPTVPDYEEMSSVLSADGFAFAVTIKVSDGSIGRVGIYAVKFSENAAVASQNRTLGRFFTVAPSYDKEDLNIVSWSYAKSGKSYMKGERSYCGELNQILASWSSDFCS